MPSRAPDMEAGDSRNTAPLKGKKILALAGGVGGAKLAYGLYKTVPPGQLTVISNTGDDIELYGLRICPDIDTLTYTLSGVANPSTGWGVEDDTFFCLSMLGRYGLETWFSLGDKDLATHIIRTNLLKAGHSLTEVTKWLARSLGVRAKILPMSDERVQTHIELEDGLVAFQEYFVRRKAQGRVLGVKFKGVEMAKPTADVISAISEADLIVFCPSNPVASILPILSVPGMRDLLKGASAKKAAVSPIVAGKAISGPAAALMEGLGLEVSPLGLARLYEGLIDAIFMDKRDEALSQRIASSGAHPIIAEIIMKDPGDKISLAKSIFGWAFGVPPFARGFGSQ